MDVLRRVYDDQPPTPLLITDFQNMTEELKAKNMISVVHYPKPLFKRCTNPHEILKIEGVYIIVHALSDFSRLSPFAI